MSLYHVTAWYSHLSRRRRQISSLVVLHTKYWGIDTEARRDKVRLAEVLLRRRPGYTNSGLSSSWYYRICLELKPNKLKLFRSIPSHRHVISWKRLHDRQSIAKVNGYELTFGGICRRRNQTSSLFVLTFDNVLDDCEVFSGHYIEMTRDHS